MEEQRICTRNRARFVSILGAVLLVAGCARPFHPTPLDALTEFPGHLVNRDMYVEESVEVLQEQEVAGGLALLYRWQSPESQTEGTYCAGTTFVTPVVTLKGKGWRARSSGSVGNLLPLDVIFQPMNSWQHIPLEATLPV